MGHLADALDEEMLPRNINRELDPELQSSLKLRNASQSLSIYNHQIHGVNQKLKTVKINLLRNMCNKLRAKNSMIMDLVTKS